MKTYYKITEKISKNWEKNIFIKIFEKILYCIFPSQNPDLDKNFEKNSYWLIEFENNIPTREIALNKENVVITKMPDGKNFGFWTDANMEFSDFSDNFIKEKIDENCFENFWKK